MFQICLRYFGILILFFSTACSPLQDVTEDQFDALDADIASGSYGEINSLLIWHDGSLDFESYYRGTDRDTMNQVYSVTKSITSAAMGIAIEEQKIAGLDDSIFSYFPDQQQIENFDANKEAITLEDLLTMQAGFQWDELSTIYGSNENDATQISRSRNWVKYILDKEMAAEPGTTFAYNSGVSVLLGAILQQAARQTAEAYTAVNLFEPLGITEWQWDQTPNGFSNTGWGLYLRPIDMLKFGQLYLQEGNWEGAQIITKKWVEQSTQPSANSGDNYVYGYQWWRFADQNPIVANLTQNDVYFAWGFGGNFIFVVPHLNLVVVSTATNFEESTLFFPVLSEHIFPLYE